MWEQLPQQKQTVWCKKEVIKEYLKTWSHDLQVYFATVGMQVLEYTTRKS